MTKKVKAPLTYNPGKGRPKEHLAYLNYQEMQALKRLNGNNQERGPKGLPSFPPADAAGSSSKASSSKSSTSKSTGGKMGSSSSQSGGVSKGSAAGKDSGAGRSGGGGSGGGPRSGAAGTRSPTSGGATGSGKGPSMSKDTGGKSPSPRSGLSGTRSPTSGSKLSSSGQKPGGIADLGGGKRATGDTPGTKIKGAIQTVKDQTYVTAPRYKQPQAERMANPTAVPTMERTVNERLNMAEANRQRQAAQIARVAREGVFGAPAYGGGYNPATGRYDARPTAAQRAQSPVGMDPSIAGRLAQANKNYATVQSGPYVSRVYRDPDIKSPTLGETISGYASRVADAVFGPETQKYADQYSQSFTDFGNRFSKMVDTMKPQVSPVDQDYQNFAKAMSPYTTGDIAIRNAMTVDKNISMADEYDRVAAEQGILSANEARKIGASASTKPKQIVDRITPSGVRSPSLEGARPYDIRVTEPPATGIDLRAPAKTRSIAQGTVEPMGYNQPGEKVLAVENVPEAGIAALGPMQDYPKYVSPEVQADMARIDKLNRAGVRVAKQAPVVGNVAKILDAGRKLITGKSTTEFDADLKRQYMQSSPEQQAALETKYPNLTKFANDAGVGSQLPMSNYQSWAQKSGLTGSGTSLGGSDRGGIASLTVPTDTVAPAPTQSTTGTTQMGGPRPYIHFQWDLGLNVPKPTDPNYPDYHKYLASRTASAAAIEGA